MKIICAWCGKNIGERFEDIEGISHGVCDECLAKIKVKTDDEASAEANPEE